MEFFAAMRAAVPGLVASAIISGLILHYLRRYIDKRLEKEAALREKETQMRVKRSQLERQRRKALGRLLFWMKRAITQPPPGDDLEEALEAFQRIEDQQLELEQQAFAEYEIEQKYGL